MKYNPKIHNRRSIRLKGYDYGQAGFYFVTICCQNRACLFGKVEAGKMILNDAGKMIEKWYWKLENKFPDIQCMNMVVMPNHFHCIIRNIGNVGTAVGTTAGANPRVRPNIKATKLGTVIQWFKTMTTNEYIRGVKTLDWQRFDGKLWQRNYWENIIRNDKSLERIANYIDKNPMKWGEDKFLI